jgi:hypothetical protein
MHQVMRSPSPGSGHVRSVSTTRLGRALTFWREAVALALVLFAGFMWAAFAIPVIYESQAVIEVSAAVGTLPPTAAVEERLRGVLCEPERLGRLFAGTRSPANGPAESGPSCSAIRMRPVDSSRWTLSLEGEDPTGAARGVAFLSHELTELVEVQPQNGAATDATPARAPALLDGLKVGVIAEPVVPQSPMPSMRPTLVAMSGPVSLALGALWALVRAGVFGWRGRRRAEQSPSRGAMGGARIATDPGQTPLAAEVETEEPAVALLVVARGTGFDVIGTMTRVAGRTPPPGAAGEDASVPFVGQTDPAEAEREALHLIEVDGAGGGLGARALAWQTIAVLRERRGAWASALEARRGAVNAAHADGLAERECVLQVDLGTLLMAMGARTEAHWTLVAGLDIARRAGYQQGLRRACVHMLAWKVTFGSDPELEAELSEIRATADGALRGGWIASDRTALGLLYYRACELIASGDPSATDNAAALLQMAVEACRSTGNDMYLAPALGMWARAELGRKDAERAITLAGQARDLVAGAVPGLPDPVPIYLALHDGHAEMGDTNQARGAVVAGLATVLRRLQGVTGTSYAGPFLRGLPHTVALLDLARKYGMQLADLKEQMESAG